MSRLRALLRVSMIAMLSSSVHAQTDTTMTYQGELRESGAPADGTYNIDISLWDAVTNGTQIGPEVMFNGLPVSGGLFSVELDFGASAFDNTDRWLEISVNGTELSPRQPVTRAPYAIQTRGIFVDDVGNVGIGTTTPTFPLHVESNGTAIYGRTNSTTSASGVYGEATASGGFTYGGRFLNASTFGRGVQGEATASSGTTYGGRFESSSTGGLGVYGFANAGTGTTFGVFGQSFSSSGTGVHGEANATTGTTFGVSGRSISSSGRGVYGFASRATGVNYGGWFETNSSSGHGVFGIATRTSGITYGGRFETNSTVGRGVFGLASANSGVNFGVVGHTNSSSGFDFWASGAGTNYGSPSSRRFKSNVVPIGDPLDKLAKLQGVYFDWDEEHGGLHDVGMIAEEVGAVLPEIVNYEENGVDAIGMDYSKLTPLLVEAVNALNERHEAEIVSKNAQISELAERIARLESLIEQRDAYSVD